MKSFYMYIMASQPNGTLYVGVTGDLVRRVYEHKEGFIKSFTKKYAVNQLVYFEEHGSYCEAARREKRLKNWPRRWKVNLINSFNPEWKDLYEMII